MSIVFISHPFSSDPALHSSTVVNITRRIALQGHLPLAPQIYLPAFLKEDTERDLALKLCLQFVRLADEVLVYGEPTEGMQLEIAEARRLGIPVNKEKTQ